MLQTTAEVFQRASPNSIMGSRLVKQKKIKEGEDIGESSFYYTI